MNFCNKLSPQIGQQLSQKYKIDLSQTATSEA